MIPFLRSLSELIAVTESRVYKNKTSQNGELYSSIIDSGQRKRYIRSIDEPKVDQNHCKKKIWSKCENRKEVISKLSEYLDYSNQIQSSYDITLLATQNETDQNDFA
tara:strand:- start:368 stop:688 length:321 start_codon:yes stop_codon:yes gene_type:complete